MSTRTATAAKPRARSSAPVQLKGRRKNAPRELLFAIDDVEYTMPVTVELGDSLSLAAILRLQPTEDAKRMTLVRQLCGPQALAALLDDATMTRAEWERLGEILSERAFGPPEQREDEAQGN